LAHQYALLKLLLACLAEQQLSDSDLSQVLPKMAVTVAKCAFTKEKGSMLQHKKAAWMQFNQADCTASTARFVREITAELEVYANCESEATRSGAQQSAGKASSRYMSSYIMP